MEFMDRLEGLWRLRHRDAFGDLEREAVGAEPTLGQDVAHELRQVRFDLPWRQVDRDLDGIRPAHRLRTRRAQHPLAEPSDESARFGDWNELAWAEQATYGVLPSHQCFGTHNSARSKVLNRLVVQNELVTRDGNLECLLGVEAFEGAFAHLGLVAHEAATT